MKTCNYAILRFAPTLNRRMIKIYKGPATHPIYPQTKLSRTQTRFILNVRVGAPRTLSTLHKLWHSFPIRTLCKLVLLSLLKYCCFFVISIICRSRYNKIHELDLTVQENAINVTTTTAQNNIEDMTKTTLEAKMTSIKDVMRKTRPGLLSRVSHYKSDEKSGDCTCRI